MKTKSLKFTVLTLFTVLVLGMSLFAVMISKAEAPSAIIDDCNVIEGEGAVTSDRYQITTQSDDIGFGADKRFITSQSPTAPHDSDTIWERAYINYNVSGQNLLEVWVDTDPGKVGVIPAPVVCVGTAGSAKFMDVNNVSVEASTNWSRIKYTYILNMAEATYARVFFSIYKNETPELATWMQQITKVQISYAEELPEMDNTYYVDKMDTHAIVGQRSDVYNVSVANDHATTVGDTSRITFGDGNDETYITYTLKSQDTIVATFYEEILAGDARPEIETIVKFGVVGDNPNWDKPATKTDVEIGRFAAPKRYTRITYTYVLPSSKNAGDVRINIPKNTNKAQLQLGRVEIFDSKKPPVKDVANAVNASFKVSGWISPSEIGSGAISDSVDFDNKIVEMLSSGINTILPNIWTGDTLEYRHRLLGVAAKYGAKAYVYDEAFVTELKKTSDYSEATAESVISTYKQHPAFIGHFIIDEPTSAQLSELSTASARYKALLSGKTFYVNLLPEHAVSDYSAYLSDYFTKLDLDYISFDYYVLKGKAGDYSMKTTYLKNLDLVAKAAKANDARMYTILGATGHYNRADGTYLRRPTSVGDLGFPAYAAMAYGTKSVTWFTYMAMNNDAESGEAQYGMIDSLGNKTEVFGFAKTLNDHLDFMSDAYNKYSYNGTMLVEGTTAPSNVNPSFSAVTNPVTTLGGVTSVTATEDMIAGGFINGDDYALMLSNYTDPSLNISTQVTITFGGDYTLSVYQNSAKTNISLPTNKQYTLTLAPGEGAFIEMGALAVLKANAKTEIREYADAKGEANYSNAGWTEINAAVESAERAIDIAVDADGIDVAVTAAKSAIDAVITKAQEDLASYKTAKLDEALAYFTALGENNYSVASWAKITALKATADIAINAAANTVAIDAAVTAFKTVADAVLTKIEEDAAIASAPTYVDECIGNEKSGQRSDVYNLATRTNVADKVGDDTRIIFGTGNDESFVDYKLLYQDTIMVIAYEQILVGNVRPSTLEAVKFGVVGDNIKWDISATDTQVILGDYATGRFTKILYTFKFVEAQNVERFRVMIKNQGEFQETVQLGKVIIYNSHNSEREKLLTKVNMENAFHFMGRSNYSDAGWDLVFAEYEKGLAAITNAVNSAGYKAAYDAAVVAMGEVKTADFDFNQLKLTRKAELEAYGSAKGESNYTVENWAKIQEVITKGKLDIDSAVGESALTIVFNEAKDAIDKVEKRSSGNTEPPTSGNTKKGCKSELSANGSLAIIIASIAIMCAALLIIVKKNRKTDTNQIK